MNDDELAAISAEKLWSRINTRAISARARGDVGDERYAVDDLILFEIIEADRAALVAALAEARADLQRWQAGVVGRCPHREGHAEAALAEAHRTLADVEKLAVEWADEASNPEPEWHVPDTHGERVRCSTLRFASANLRTALAASRSGAESAGEQR